MSYNKLFSPLKVGPLMLKNRIVAAPSVTYLEEVPFFETLAKGGAAAVTVGECVIGTMNSKTHPKQFVMTESESQAALAEIADRIHLHNAYASIEISHGGALAEPAYNGGANAIGPVGFVDKYGNTVAEMTPDMMHEAAESFADAAETAKCIGFDMSMLHCGHGWLLSQFLSPLTNTRTDEYGGKSLESRALFPLMVLQKVRERVGRGYALDLRISGSEFLDGGIGIEEAAEFAVMASEYVDIINVSAGAPWTKRMSPHRFHERGINACFAAEVKKRDIKIPVSTVGGFVDPAHMEAVLESGGADAIYIMRGLIADPELPNKAKNGKADEIRRCIRCFSCIEYLYPERLFFHCAINPLRGREETARGIPPPSDKKKVLVAGGGPAGIQAAIAAAERGHAVTLYTKGEGLGGGLALAGRLPFNEDQRSLLELYKRTLARQGVMIKLGTELTPDLAKQEGADVIIAAIGGGGAPGAADIPGSSLGHVRPLSDIFSIGKPDGRDAVIIGGESYGCEAAIWLAQQGARVTLLDSGRPFGAGAAPNHVRALWEKVEELEINVMENTRCTCIGEKYVEFLNARGETGEIPAHAVFFADSEPRQDEAWKLRDCAGEFIAAGNCRKTGNLTDAIRDGFFAGASL